MFHANREANRENENEQSQIKVVLNPQITKGANQIKEITAASVTSSLFQIENKHYNNSNFSTPSPTLFGSSLQIQSEMKAGQTDLSSQEEKRKAYKKTYREIQKEKIKARNKAYREAHKEEIKARNKAYKEAHKEEIKARDRAYIEAHKVEIKAYRETHKEEIKARNKTYKEACKEELKIRNKIYRETHREEINARRRAYRARKRRERELALQLSGQEQPRSSEVADAVMTPNEQARTNAVSSQQIAAIVIDQTLENTGTSVASASSRYGSPVPPDQLFLESQAQTQLQTEASQASLPFQEEVNNLYSGDARTFPNAGIEVKPTQEAGEFIAIYNSDSKQDENLIMLDEDREKIEQSKAYQKTYYQKNKEKIKARNKAYKEAHKEEIKARNRAYKARKKRERELAVQGLVHKRSRADKTANAVMPHKEKQAQVNPLSSQQLTAITVDQGLEVAEADRINSSYSLPSTRSNPSNYGSPSFSSQAFFRSPPRIQPEMEVSQGNPPEEKANKSHESELMASLISIEPNLAEEAVETKVNALPLTIENNNYGSPALFFSQTLFENISQTQLETEAGQTNTPPQEEEKNFHNYDSTNSLNLISEFNLTQALDETSVSSLPSSMRDPNYYENLALSDRLFFWSQPRIEPEMRTDQTTLVSQEEENNSPLSIEHNLTNRY